MKFTKQLNRFLHLDQLIRLKATGNPKNLARKIGVSESALYEYINEMKEMNAPISYDKVRNSYCYTEKVKLEFGFKKMENDTIDKIKGGVAHYYLYANFDKPIEHLSL
jgi:predicted DNA-binding transcriptional regulator YafY